MTDERIVAEGGPADDMDPEGPARPTDGPGPTGRSSSRASAPR